MSRTIPTSVQSNMDSRYGTEPLVVLLVEWEDNNVYYSTKALTIEAQICVPTINQIGAISNTTKIGGVGSYSSTSVTIIDEDGTIKQRVNRYQLDGTKCTVYHHYVGGTLADLVPILSGELTESNWASGIFECSIETAYKSEEVGYAPELDAFAGFNNDVAGTAWPMCFGTVLEVPCVNATKFGASSKMAYGWPLNWNEIGTSANMIVPEYRTVNGNYIYPVGSEIDIFVAGVKFRGQFAFGAVQYYKPQVTDSFGQVFYFLNSLFTIRFEISANGINLPIHENLITIDRDESDQDYDNEKVFWIDDSNDLTGLYVYISGQVNFVEYQDGEKCFCRQKWNATVAGGITILETAPIPRSEWLNTYILKPGDDTYDRRVNSRAHTENPYLVEFIANGAIVKDQFFIYKGAGISQYAEGNKELFVCNLVPSTEIVDVWAYRTYNNQKIYAPVPISRYIKHLSYPLGGKNVTCLEFPVPLDRYESEQWDNTIYVSLRSSITYNTAYAIQYVVENYTNLTVDQASFDAVSAKVQDFWMCFYLTETIDAINLIEEMARQARCGLVNSNGVIKIVFLADAPGTKVIDGDWTGAQSLQISNTSLEEIRTRLIANWKKKHDQEHAYVYSNNENTYGTIEEEVDVSLYNMEYCVSAFANFWGYRYSNVWRRLGFRTFLNALDREVYDGVTVRLSEFSANDVRGVLDNLSHDSETDTIEIAMEMASRKTDIDGGFEPIEDPNYWPGNPVPPSIKDPAHGRSEVEYKPPVVRKIEREEEEPPQGLFFEVLIAPTSAERGVNQELRVRIVDGEGNPNTANRVGTIEVAVGDPSELINYGNISFPYGEWHVSDFQFTGGAGTDQTTLLLRGTGIQDKTIQLEVYDTPVTIMTWTIYPSSPETRGNSFTVQIQNGPPNQAIDIEFIHSDGSDKLYFNGTTIQVTSVTLDAGGNYTGTWFVNGGTGDLDFFAMNAHDPNYVYGSAYGPQITIGGASIAMITHKIKLSDDATQTDLRAELLVYDPVEQGSPFQADVNIYYQGVLHSNFNGSALLKAYDPDAQVFLPWVTGGPNATVQPDPTELVVNIVNGVWTYADCELDWTGLTVANLYFSLDMYIYDPNEDETFHLTYEEIKTVTQPTVKTFTITITPDEMTRGIAATFRITARVDGEVNIAYVPSGPLALVLVSTDPADDCDVTVIAELDWVDGEASFPIVVSGGTGSDSLLFYVEDLPMGYYGEGLAVIDSVYQTVGAISSADSFIYADGGLQIGQTDEFDASYHWANVINSVLASYAGQGLAGGLGNIRRWFNDEHGYPHIEASLEDARMGYNLTVPQRDNIVSGKIILTSWVSEETIKKDAFNQGNSYYWNNGQLRFKLSEDANDLDTIAKISTNPTFTIPFSQCNQLADNQGARYWTGSYWRILRKTIEIPMPSAMVNFISNMTGLTLYMSVYASSYIPGYQYPDYSGGDSFFINGYRGINISTRGNNLKILT